MPKMKTNRMAYKKYRANASGKLKRGQAFKSHNTAKKTPKRRRQLRGSVEVSAADKRTARRLLPYLKKQA
ncbi:MAG: 50S ribosomal protein L35 [Candidatus Dadabacteria bacterium]|nr:MAG: 50S ribosomal protein L35 [Candidatus Dadabacteria bacterium]